MIVSIQMDMLVNLLFWPSLLNDKDGLTYTTGFLMYGAMIILPLIAVLVGLAMFVSQYNRKIATQLILVGLILGLLSLVNSSLNNVGTVIYVFLGPALILLGVLRPGEIKKKSHVWACIVAGGVLIYLLTLPAVALFFQN